MTDNNNDNSDRIYDIWDYRVDLFYFYFINTLLAASYTMFVISSIMFHPISTYKMFNENILNPSKRIKDIMKNNVSDHKLNWSTIWTNHVTEIINIVDDMNDKQKFYVLVVEYVGSFIVSILMMLNILSAITNKQNKWFVTRPTRPTSIRRANNNLELELIA